MRKTYLAVFVLPKPEPEHKRIVDVIKDVSGGDYKAAFFGGSDRGANCAGYLFTSELPAWKISFPKVLMNNDSVLIVELGGDFQHQNLGMAAAWLKSHQKQ